MNIFYAKEVIYSVFQQGAFPIASIQKIKIDYQFMPRVPIIYYFLVFCLDWKRAVSYTHLDVYKRQNIHWGLSINHIHFKTLNKSKNEVKEFYVYTISNRKHISLYSVSAL